MRKSVFLSIFSILITASIIFFLSANYVISAETQSDKTAEVDTGNTTDTSSTKSVKLNNPLTGNTTGIAISTLSGRIIKAILGLVGSVSLLMFVIGGFLWLTSAGNEERVKKGRQTIVWAALGLIIVFSSYAVLKFLFEALNKLKGQ